MPYVLAAGELLIDFTPIGCPGNNQILYEQNPGGAPANVAVCLSRLGVKSGFAGKVGDDEFGRFLKATLEANGVCTSGLKLDRAATTLAFVHLTASGERAFSFYRNPGADTRLDTADIDFAELDRCDALHFGSLLFTAEPARTAMLKMLDYAKGKGKLVSYDPNWRPALWASIDDGLREMKNGLRYCDVVKVSDAELFLLAKSMNMQDGINELLDLGIGLVLVTQGKFGCCAANRRFTVSLPAFDVRVADTTGCGDSAMAGCLYKIFTLKKALCSLDEDDLLDIANFANACGALCATKHGGIPAMPSLHEIGVFLKK